MVQEKRVHSQPTAPLGRDFVSKMQHGSRKVDSVPTFTQGIHTYGIARLTVFDPLSLMLSGDVEPNPGPYNPARPKQGNCAICGKYLRNNPVRCASSNCEIRAHRSCSGHKSQNCKKLAWLCPSHCSIPSSLPTLTFSTATQKISQPQIPSSAPILNSHSSTSINPNPKCKLCKGSIRRNTNPIICSSCGLPSHKKCTGLTLPLQKAVIQGSHTWTCKKCMKLSGLQDFTSTSGGSKIESAATNVKKQVKSSLHIMQWNADGISTKVSELESRLIKGDYDICLLQETKLRPGKSTPSIKGYVSIRTDRPRQDGGGGLLVYIKNSLIFERVQESSKSGTESSTFRVRIGKKKWLTICNIYCPPSRSKVRTNF